LSSSTEFVAWGPTAVGFQTSGTEIEIGVYGAGKQLGVAGRCENGAGVKGSSPLLGVYGIGSSTSAAKEAAKGKEPKSPRTTGVLGDGYFNATGVVGVCFRGDERTDMGLGIGIMGASNADSEDEVPGVRGAGVVGMSTKELPLGDGYTNLPVLPNQQENQQGNVDGEGTGVWGLSDAGVGVHGQSKQGRGGVFESQAIAQIRLKPTQNNVALPSEGEAGDLFVKLVSNRAELWFCILGYDGETSAQWQKIS
jgi:hypothetical protein